jgi:hypothetical protein
MNLEGKMKEDEIREIKSLKEKMKKEASEKLCMQKKYLQKTRNSIQNLEVCPYKYIYVYIAFFDKFAKK